MEKRFLNVNELAIYLGLSPETIWAWKKKGRIPFSKIYGAVRFDMHKIETWLKEKERPCLV